MKLDKWLGEDVEARNGEKPIINKAFARDYKGELRRIAKSIGCKVEIGKDYFEFSGFFSNGKNFVYFSTGDIRCSSDNWNDNILIRTAEHNKDWTGGRNNSTTLEDMAEDVKNLLV